MWRCRGAAHNPAPVHHEEMTVDDVTPPMSDEPRPKNVAVIGNSNSVAVTSYARLLASIPGLNVTNRSLGGVPNIALLTFLTDETVDFSTLDFIIVDVAVIEADILYPGSAYSMERSRRFIDLFASEVRRRSKAGVLFLILPTLSSMLDPKRNYVEQHYLDCARAWGASVLNIYALIRRYGGLDAAGPPRGLAVLVDRFLARFELPLSHRDPYLWRMWLRQHPANLQKPDIGTVAFAESCFEDPLHVSRAMHDVIAGIIHSWIKNCPAERQDGDAAPAGTGLVARAPPEAVGAAEYVRRESTLIRRHLVSITAGGVVNYRCPPDFLAVGIMLNECETSGYLTLRSALGDVSLDARFKPFPLPWKALVILILEEIGGGDICISISDQPEARLTALKPYYNVARQAADTPCRAELGELLLVHRTVLDGSLSASSGADLPDLERLEEAPYAQDILVRQGEFGAKAVNGVRRSGAVISRAALKAALEKFQPGATGAGLIKDKARLLALAGELGAALATLAEGRRQYPDDRHLADLENVIKPLMP